MSLMMVRAISSSPITITSAPSDRRVHLVVVMSARHLSALHQRFVITSVHADAPGLVLPELDPRGASRVEGMLGVVSARLRRRQPFAEDHRLSYAITSAIASTASLNSSRDPVCAA